MRFLFLCFAVIASFSSLAELEISSGLVSYKADENMIYSLDGEELQVQLRKGEEIEVDFSHSLIFLSESSKEIIQPLMLASKEQLNNIDSLIGLEIPVSIRHAAIFHLKFGRRSLCRLVLVNSELDFIGDDVKKDFYKKLKVNKITMNKLDGYQFVNCIGGNK